MADVRQAGLAMGYALKAMNDRLNEIEKTGINVTVPVPAVEVHPPNVTVKPADITPEVKVPVTVKVPDFPAIDIDFTEIVDAIQTAHNGDGLVAVGQIMQEAIDGAALAQADTAKVLTALIDAIGTQQSAISDLVKRVDGMGREIVRAMNTPKELIFDDMGEPIGLASRTLN